MSRVSVVYEGVVFTVCVPSSLPAEVSVRAALLYARSAYAFGVRSFEERDALVSRCVCQAFADLGGLEYAPE